MDSVLKQISLIAQKYNIGKVILFGSRARGDNTPKSDYDIAFVYPNLQLNVKNDIIDEINSLDTLCKIDIVFLNDLNGQDELTKNIITDGVTVMNKFETKFANYKKALAALNNAILDFDKTELLSVRDGTIQRFEFTTELAWKTVREYLLNEGMTDINTPKSVMKEAFAAGVIDDEQGWLQILNDRNGTSHIYDESQADAIFDRIRSKHITLFEKLELRLAERE